MKSNWNLPPGVSARDIEPKMVKCPVCDGEGTIFIRMGDEDMSKECPRCDGTGEIPTDQLGVDE